MKLVIDTSSNKCLQLWLRGQTKKIEYHSPRDQDLLNEIHHFLQEKSVSLENLTSIEVNPGPGTFTSLRTGISVAQALSFALNISINSKQPGSSVHARYGQLPSITIKK